MKTFFVVILILTSRKIVAQDYDSYMKQPPQAVFAEIFGHSLNYSANYDRRLFKKINGLGFTVGISYCPDPTLFSIPVNINYLLGNKGHYLEFGAGVTYFNGTLNNSNFEDRFYTNYLNDGKVSKMLEVLTLGYRSQPIENLVFRIGLNGWLNNEPEKRLINPLPYFALGYSF